jgi:hypothetical protein
MGLGNHVVAEKILSVLFRCLKQRLIIYLLDYSVVASPENYRSVKQQLDRAL